MQNSKKEELVSLPIKVLEQAMNLLSSATRFKGEITAGDIAQVIVSVHQAVKPIKENPAEHIAKTVTKPQVVETPVVEVVE